MTTLSVLPPELISCILQYVPDKMGCYMACKSCGVCLEQMFKDGQLSDINDSYYLAKFHNNDTIFSADIHNIHNHNSLNFLSSHEKTKLRLPAALLRQNCVMDNISRPNYIYDLFENVIQRLSTEIRIILDILFYKKFYDMIKIISKHQHFLNYWAVSFVWRNMCSCNINDEIKQEIITMVNMNIATPEMIYGILTKRFFFDTPIIPHVVSFLKDTYPITT
jgi:hypothetical protein